MSLVATRADHVEALGRFAVPVTAAANRERILQALAATGPGAAAFGAALAGVWAPLNELNDTFSRLADRVGAPSRGETDFHGDAQPLGVLRAAQALALALTDAGRAYLAISDAATAAVAPADKTVPIEFSALAQLAAVAHAAMTVFCDPASIEACPETGLIGARVFAALENLLTAARAYAVAAHDAQAHAPANRHERRAQRSATRHLRVLTEELDAALQRLGALITEVAAGVAAEAVSLEGLWRELANGLRLTLPQQEKPGMTDARPFVATVAVKDEAAEAISRIGRRMSGLTNVARAVGEHARGMGVVLRAAFGEAREGAKKAEHGMHRVAESVAHVGNALHKTGEEAVSTDEKMGALSQRARHYEVLAAHFSLLHTRFGTVGMRLGEIGHSAAELMPALAGLGALGGLAETFELVNQTAEGFSELARAASVAGASMRQMQEIRFTAKLHDIAPDIPEHALARLGVTLGQVHRHTNPMAESLLKHLHLNTNKSAADLLPQLADAFKATKSESMRQLMAQTLFGRGGIEMLPLLDLGGEEFRKLASLSDRFNFLPSKEQMETLEEFHGSMIKLSASVQGFRDALGTSLAPVLQPIVDRMAEWVRDNRDWLANDITDAVERVGDALKKVDWKGVGDAVKSIAEKAGELADKFGGVRGTLEALLALKVTGWALEWVARIGEVTVAVRELTGAVTAFDTAISGSLLGRFVTKIAPVGTRLAGGVFAGLYTFFNPTPTQTEDQERVQLDAWLKKHGYPTPPHPDMRALSNAVAENPPAPPPPRWPPRLPGFPAPIHYGEAEMSGRKADDLLRRSLYGPGGAAAPARPPPAGSAPGTVRTEVIFKNTPPGTQVRTQTTARVHADVDVGYAMPELGIPPR